VGIDHDEVAPKCLDMSTDISSGAAVLAEVVVNLSGTKSVVTKPAFREQLQATSLSEQGGIALLVADGAVASAKLPIGDFGKIHLVFDLSTMARASVGGSRGVVRHCQVRVLEVYKRGLEVYNKISLYGGRYRSRSSQLDKLEDLRGSATRVYDVWKSIDL